MAFLPRVDPFARRMLQGSMAFAAMMLVMFAVFSTVYLHLNPRCSEEIVAQSLSPDGRFAAAIMERRCGESVQIVTHVNLRPVETPVRMGYFTGRAKDGQVFAVELTAAEAAPDLRWTANTELTIACEGCGNPAPSQTDAAWGAVRIRYPEDKTFAPRRHGGTEKKK
jgi:hypothetical protein